MRPDMKKVIREDGRLNSEANWETRHLRRNKVRVNDLVEYVDDDGVSVTDVEDSRHKVKAVLKSAPIRPGKIAGCGWYRKQSNADTRPLDRYLRSRVGQLWDNVYSDICKTLPKGDEAVVGTWTYGHLKWVVVTDVVMVEGKPKTHMTECGRYQDLDDEGLIDVLTKFYVHPETGILCQVTPTRPARRTLPEVARRELEFEKSRIFYRAPEHNEIAFPNEGWYRLTWIPFSQNKNRIVTDKLHGTTALESEIFERFYERGSRWRAVSYETACETGYCGGVEQITDKGTLRRIEAEWLRLQREKRNEKKIRRTISEQHATFWLQKHNAKVNSTPEPHVTYG